MTTTEATDLNAARRAYTPKADLDEAQRNYDYDMAKFLKYSSTREINPDPAALAAFLTSAYHSLEKGLTMEIPRAGFGQTKIPPILATIEELERSGHESYATRGARGLSRARSRTSKFQKAPPTSATEVTPFLRKRTSVSSRCSRMSRCSSA